MRRILTEDEQILTDFLLKKIGSTLDIPNSVDELGDGGMGTIRFPSDRLDSDRRYQQDLIQVSYKDLDNIIVLITLTQDNFDNLFELEFWKTNFDALKQFPTPDKVEVVQPPTT